jgi:hypothetical protein
MENGKKYRVFYHDGIRVRDKVLIFKFFSKGFAIFFNPLTQAEESLNLHRIIRVEEIKEGE